MFKNIRLVFLLFLSLASFSFYILSDSIETTRLELSKINSELNQKKNELATIKKKEYKVLSRLRKVKRELGVAKNKLSYERRRLKKTAKKLKELKTTLEKEQKKLDKGTILFKKRIREIHKSQGLGYLELFFSSKTLADFISRSYYFERIIIKDVEIIKKLKKQKEKIAKTKSYIGNKQWKIKQLTHSISRKKSNIQKKLHKENQLYKQIYKQRQRYEKEIIELKRNSKEIEILLKNLLAKKKAVKLKGTGKYIWPLSKDFWISSSYGYRRHPIFRVVKFHSGIDLAAKRGSVIRAADSGEVVFTGWWGGYGKAIIINHGNEYSTVYAHLSRIIKKEGETTIKGEKIGLVGTTGYATGPHLHFEIRHKGKTINPIKLLPKRYNL